MLEDSRPNIAAPNRRNVFARVTACSDTIPTTGNGHRMPAPPRSSCISLAGVKDVVVLAHFVGVASFAAPGSRIVAGASGIIARFVGRAVDAQAASGCACAIVREYDACFRWGVVYLMRSMIAYASPQ